jgi:[calcium/calmodulin-dependent protein kinase] kinase
MRRAYGTRGETLGRGAYGEVYKYASEKSETTDGTRTRTRTRTRTGTGTGTEATGTTGEETATTTSGRGRANAYAVKELNKRKLANVRVGSSRTLLDAAEEEIRMQSECRCANVVEAYEWVNDARESTAKIVMEYCERGSVVDDERDTFERFDLSDVKAIARDVLRALRTCHARNIAHYDVKPQNIFASASGAYKLGDFGCATRVKPIAVGSRREAKARAKAKANAKTNANASELERTHEFVGKTPGTPAFTAPECCEGEPCDGFKADVWALGMTLHALATGRYFYQADGAWDTYQKVLRESVDLGEIARLGDDGFTDFMTRVLERDPNERLTARQALKHPWITPERRDDDAGAREKSRKKSIWRRLFSRRGRRR